MIQCKDKNTYNINLGKKENGAEAMVSEDIIVEMVLNYLLKIILNI